RGADDASRMDSSTAVSRNPNGLRTWPWYRLYPNKAILVAAGLFVAVSVLTWFNDGSGQAIAVLYVLPVALLAVTMGERGGLTGAAAGFSLFAVLEVEHSSGDIDVTGWVVRAVAMFLIGGLLGRATDQTTASEQAVLAEQERRRQVEEANLRYTAALEINDSLLQQIVVAKWMVEQSQPKDAAKLLTEAIARGENMIAGLLPERVVSSEDSSIAIGSNANVMPQCPRDRLPQN
ncbi:MAG TPA: hypothetical protein VNG12_21570, partial [Acidimicrobiales bacterium]|nr:hypothetical protein [Acidimicrobiales bacterium]